MLKYLGIALPHARKAQKGKKGKLRMYSSKKILSIFLTAIMAISLVAMAMPVAVEAQVPYITVTPTSGRGVLEDGSAAFDGWSSATEVTVTGYNFESEQDSITIRIASVDEDITTTAGKEVTLRYYSIAGSAANSVKADANGYFQAVFRLPSLKAGMYNVFAVYTPEGGVATTTSGALFEVKPDILILEENSQSSTGVYNSRVHILLTGFEGDEEVSIIPTNFLVTAPDGTDKFTSFKVNADGCTSGLKTNVGYLSGARQGGTVNVIIFGSSSGITVSKSFTIKPTIAFDLDNDDALEPTVSIPVAASTVYLWGRNWVADTEIPANSLKIKTEATSYITTHSKITVPSTGAFGPIAVTYFDNLPAVQLSVELYGTTFSLAAENIIPPPALRDAQYSFEINRGRGIYHLAGALMASDPVRPDYVTLSASTFKHSGNARSALYLLAVSGTPSTAWSVTWDGSPVTLKGMTTTDANGAAVAFIDDVPTGTARKFGDHDLVFGGALSGAASQTLKVIPYLSSFVEDRGYRERLTITGYGFAPDEPVSITIGGLSWFTVPTTSIGPDGYFSVVSDPIPKLPSGSQTVVAKGTSSDNTASRSRTIKPVVIRDPTSTISEPLTTNVAAVGDPVVLRSSVTIGVFGLKANTVHNVVVGGVKVATFTTTSDGTIPGAVSFTVPTLKSGLYYVDIVDTTTGKSALLGLTRYYSPPYSGYTYTGETYRAYEPGLNSYTNAGDGLLLRVTIGITVTPTATNVGAEATLTGSGLTPNTLYYITISDNPTTLSGPYVGYVLGEFTSTAGGAIPAGVKVTIPELANPIEAGTTWYLHVSTSSQLGDLTSTGYGSIVLYASATISPTRGRAGETVTLTLKGLEPRTLYSIYFGYVDKDNPGTIVGSVVSDSLGKASTVFTVPSLAEGDYKIKLYDTVDAEYVLNIPPVFTIGAPAVPPVGTGTFTPSAPTLLDAAARPVASVVRNTAFYVQVTLKSNVGVDVSTYVIVQIKDATGKIAALGITMADVRAGATRSVPVAFLGLPAGTYTVTIYVWDSLTTPTALAPTTTFTITVS
jgi:hypothetical protein